MNTIRRPRKRPRKKSANFRALWWVLTREAVVTLVLSWGDMWSREQQWRRYLAGCSTHRVRAIGARYLQAGPPPTGMFYGRA